MSHPLDPITPGELSRAAEILRKHHDQARLRFKMIDLEEASKKEVLAYLEAERSWKGARMPDRRARIYFHQRIESVFQKAIVNLTTGAVEKLESLPDVQGPVWHSSKRELSFSTN
jgi:primary-amine oxidase